MITIPQQPLPAVPVCMRSPGACLPAAAAAAGGSPSASRRSLSAARPMGSVRRAPGTAAACKECCPSWVPGEPALGAAGQARTPIHPATPTAEGGGNKSQPTDVVCCNCLGGEGGTCWGRKDPSPLCSVGDGRCSEKLRGCRWCPARGPWDAPARHPVPAARQVSFNCYCLAG